MKVYLDFVLLLNFYLDTLILITTSITLKRNTTLKRIFLSSLVGSISLIVLFIEINSFCLLLFKIFLAIIMQIVAFKYKDLKYTLNNLGYFFMISIILGGFIYYLYLEYQSTLLYLIFLVILSPIIIYIYYKQNKKMKSNYNLIYDVIIGFNNNKTIKVKGFLDTGNKLVDPITNKPIILIQKNLINLNKEKFYYIPFNSINNNSLLKCLKPAFVEIEKKRYKNYLIAVIDKKFNMEGVECILNNLLMEESK